MALYPFELNKNEEIWELGIRMYRSRSLKLKGEIGW